MLRRSVASGHVPHAYLFSGPEGVGKKAAAVALASALNCSARAEGEGEGCGECPDCLHVASSSHANVTVYAPEGGVIKIELVRDLAERLRFKVDRGMKVVVVDDAHSLNPAAANAFLKTLEEPPPDSVIVLVTSRASALLPTMLSRCQRINFRPLSESVLKGVLAERGAGADEASAAARLGCGSVARALVYLDSDGQEKRKEAVGILASLAGSDVPEILDAAERLSKRDDLEEVLEFFKAWFRDRAVTLEGSPGLAVNTDVPGASAAGGGADFEALWDSYTECERARFETTPPRYGNKQLLMETLLMRLVENGGLA